MKPDHSVEELWNQLQAQQKEIDALRRAQRRYRIPRRSLVGIASIAGALVLTGAVYATGPVNSNVVHACFSTKSKALSVLPKGKCPSGTTAINWDQYTAFTATSPLSVAPGVNGSAPKLALTGVVPNAHNFTGSLGGDVTGSQGATRVGGLQGVPVDSSAPTTDQVLGYNGGMWAPTGAYNPVDLATLHWNPDNAYGFYTSAPGPSGIAFDGTHMWVTDFAVNNATGSVDEFDGFGNILHTITVGKWPSAIAYDGINTLAVANQGSNTVSFISLLGTPTVSGTIDVGSGPDAICFDGRHYWVSNLNSDNVTELNFDGAVLATVSVGNSPNAIACDNAGHVWVVNGNDFQPNGSVSEIATANASVIKTIAVGSFPDGIAFDGSHVWVANTNDFNLSEIDVATQSVIKKVGVGRSPAGIVFDGSHIWVANFAGNDVSEVDVASQKLMRTIGTGAGPNQMAFDGSHIWVTDYTDNDMSKL